MDCNSAISLQNAEFVNVKTQEQSRWWMHKHSPNKAKKFKQMLSARKLITAVIWDRK
jgi:hypothetical protein